jgi:hypothetical protein
MRRGAERQRSYPHPYGAVWCASRDVAILYGSVLHAMSLPVIRQRMERTGSDRGAGRDADDRRVNGTRCNAVSLFHEDGLAVCALTCGGSFLLGATSRNRSAAY